MAASSHTPERRRTSGPVAARDDYRALRAGPAAPVAEALDDLAADLTRLDRRLAHLCAALREAARRA
jgi:hypothetical protein